MTDDVASLERDLSQPQGPPPKHWLRRIRRLVLPGLILISLVIGYFVDNSPLSTSDTNGNRSVASGPHTQPPDPATIRATAVQDLLNRHSAALLARDQQAFLATIDPQATEFRRQQRQVFANLAQVPLQTWHYQIEPYHDVPLPTAKQAAYGSSAWASQVTLQYALRDFDQRSTDRPAYFTFVQRNNQWYLAADNDLTTDDKETWRGPWDFGPVVVHQGAHSLVLAHPDRASRLNEISAIVDTAVPQVNRIWGPQWAGKVVVIIPDSVEEMRHIISDQRSLDQIAAVATADSNDVEHHIARGQRIVINPENLDQLSAIGRRVVVQHEITHIAARSVTRETAPKWLTEGFADYVGYLNSGLSTRRAAQELAQSIHNGQIPADLPSDKDFQSDNPKLSQAYQGSWLACRMLAAKLGPAKMVDFYREVMALTADQGPQHALETALHRYGGLSYQDFVAEWHRTLLAELS